MVERRVRPPATRRQTRTERLLQQQEQERIQQAQQQREQPTPQQVQETARQMRIEEGKNQLAVLNQRISEFKEQENEARLRALSLRARANQEFQQGNKEEGLRLERESEQQLKEADRFAEFRFQFSQVRQQASTGQFKLESLIEVAQAKAEQRQFDRPTRIEVREQPSETPTPPSPQQATQQPQPPREIPFEESALARDIGFVETPLSKAVRERQKPLFQVGDTADFLSSEERGLPIVTAKERAELIGVEPKPVFDVPEKVSFIGGAEVGIVASQIGVPAVLRGASKEQFETVRTSIGVAQEFLKQQGEFQREASQIISEFRQRPQEFIGKEGVEVEETERGKLITLQPEFFKKLESFKDLEKFENELVLRDIQKEQLIKAREEFKQLPKKEQIKLKAGSLGIGVGQLGVGVVEFAGGLLASGGVRGVRKEELPKTVLEHIIPPDVDLQIKPFQKLKTIREFKLKEFGEEGFVKELVTERSSALTRTFGTVGLIGLTAGGTIKTIRLSGLKAGVRETVSLVSPLRIRSGVFAPRITQLKPRQAEIGILKTKKIGTTPRGVLLKGEGRITFDVPARLTFTQVQFGARGVKITPIEKVLKGKQVVELKGALFEAIPLKPEKLRMSLITTARRTRRTVLTQQEVPVQVSPERVGIAERTIKQTQTVAGRTLSKVLLQTDKFTFGVAGRGKVKFQEIEKILLQSGFGKVDGKFQFKSGIFAGRPRVGRATSIFGDKIILRTSKGIGTKGITIAKLSTPQADVLAGFRTLGKFPFETPIKLTTRVPEFRLLKGKPSRRLITKLKKQKTVENALQQTQQSVASFLTPTPSTTPTLKTVQSQIRTVITSPKFKTPTTTTNIRRRQLTEQISQSLRKQDTQQSQIQQTIAQQQNRTLQSQQKNLQLIQQAQQSQQQQSLQQQLQQQTQLQTLTASFTSFTPFITTRAVTRLPDVPIIPAGIPFTFPLLEEKERKKKKDKLRLLFQVLLRRRGKFFEVGQPLPRGRAEQLASRELRRTLGATAKFKPVGIGKVRDIAFRLDKQVFRGFEKRKGKILRTPNQIIQRSRFRLSSRGEVMEIMEAKRRKKKK